MDPDRDDPNNHVPSVAAGDERGDPGDPGLSDPEGTGLPPRKLDRGILAKKMARKRAKRSAEAVEEVIAEAVAVAVAEAVAEEHVILPAVDGNRRFHMNVIDRAREAVEQPIPKMEPKPGIGAEEKAHKEVAPLCRLVCGERGDWGAQTARGSLRWMLYTGVGVIALIVVTVVLSYRSNHKTGRGEQSFYSQIAPDRTYETSQAVNMEMLKMRRILKMLTESQVEAKRIFAEYATAKSADDFIGLVYRAEENGGLIAKKWKSLGVKTGWKPGEQTVWTVLEQDGICYGVLEGDFPDFSSFKAFFRQDGEDLKLDWKATVGYCSAVFGTLINGQGDGSEVRAWLSPSDFHTFPLPEGQFRSFRLASPDRQESLWGYTRVGGKLDAKLIAQFIPSMITGEVQSEGEVGVIVSLGRGSTDTLPNQWLVTKFVRLNWLDD